jgi:prepilin-type N-terminal cleavage/methylation domain-containing protein
MRRCLPRARLRSGFTLLEAICALAVVAVAVAWLVSADHFAVDAATTAAGRTRAATLGASLAGEMQAGLVEPAGREGRFADAPGYRWTAEVQPVGAGPGPVRCSRVKLSVHHPGTRGAEDEVEFEFLVADE